MITERNNMVTNNLIIFMSLARNQHDIPFLRMM